jgi:hypothetical protein
MGDDRRQLDELIAALTLVRAQQVQARDDIQASMRRAEETRLQAQGLEQEIAGLIGRMTAARAQTAPAGPQASA